MYAAAAAAAAEARKGAERSQSMQGTRRPAQGRPSEDGLAATAAGERAPERAPLLVARAPAGEADATGLEDAGEGAGTGTGEELLTAREVALEDAETLPPRRAINAWANDAESELRHGAAAGVPGALPDEGGDFRGEVKSVKTKSLVRKWVSQTAKVAGIELSATFSPNDGGDESAGLSRSLSRGRGTARATAMHYSRSNIFASARRNGVPTGGRVFNPHSYAYHSWSTFLALCAAFYAMVGPPNLAFGDFSKPWKERGLKQWILSVMDMFFFVDICITFRLAYDEYGDLITDPVLIVRRTLTNPKFWFIDMVALVPFFADVAKGSNGLRGWFSLLGLCRMARMGRVVHLISELEQDANVSYLAVTVFKLVAVVLFTAHVSGCILYKLARLEDFGPDTWVGRCDPDLPNAPEYEKYVTVVYWALVTLTSVGYGDISPTSIAERVFVGIQLLANLGITAYILGNVTLLTTKADAETSAHRDRLRDVQRFMRTRNIPSELEEAALASLHLTWEMSLFRDTPLEHCPATIRSRIRRHLYREQVQRAYIFESTPSHFIDALVQEMDIEFFIQGTFVINEDEQPDAMYIILEGALERVFMGKSLDKLSRGQVVGEEALVCDVASFESMRTLSVTRTAAISRAAWKSLAEKFPRDVHGCQQTILRNIKEKLHHHRSKVAKSSGLSAKLHGDQISLLEEKLTATELGIRRSIQEVVTTVLYAAERGDSGELGRMLEGTGISVDSTNSEGRTALHLAAGNNHRGCVEVLLRMGANPNAVDNWSTCPLFEAVSRGHYEVADCIKDGGGKMLMGDPGSKLCALCYKGDLSQLGALLKYGVDPDSADYDGRCALHLAAAEGFLQCTSVLLQHGAKADVQDRWGNTPLSEAQANERGDVAAALRRALAAPAS